MKGQGVVVTGAGHGIGRAIATRLATEGARVVVNDLDGDSAKLVAEEIDGYAAPGDAASQDGVAALVQTARDHLGSIDTWFGNAGTDRGQGLDASEEDWAVANEVNVMANVRAARLLVPDWLERGGGRFVVTASAAGLLTVLGSPTYSVSKHGAVAFAEWLSVTYRHRGVVVQAICPQGVRTRMLENTGPLQELISPRRRAGARRRRRGRLAGDGRQPVPDPSPPRGPGVLRDPRRADRAVAGRDEPVAATVRGAGGPAMKVFQGIEELQKAVGDHLGHSDWHTITQEQIDLFAEATGDHQWIHVDPEKAAQGPFGTTIAHGYLTLSLVPRLVSEIYRVEGLAMGVNYGANKVRFPSPVPVGSRVRAGVEILSLVPEGPG